jgi:hypothetical protein
MSIETRTSRLVKKNWSRKISLDCPFKRALDRNVDLVRFETVFRPALKHKTWYQVGSFSGKTEAGILVRWSLYENLARYLVVIAVNYSKISSKMPNRKCLQGIPVLRRKRPLEKRGRDLPACWLSGTLRYL